MSDGRVAKYRVCKHGVRHPNPDCPAAQMDSVHGCDGCCSEFSSNSDLTATQVLGIIEECITEREIELNDMIRKGQGGDLANNAWYTVQELRVLLNKVQKRLED